MIPLPYRVLFILGAVIAVLGFVFHRGMVFERGGWEDKLEKAKKAQLQRQVVAAKGQVTEVTKYVDRIQLVEKSVPVVRDRLVRVCEPPRGDLPLPSGDPDAAPAADTVDRRDDLAAELVACRENKEQLIALQNDVRAGCPIPD
jgi:hypothetical protein